MRERAIRFGSGNGLVGILTEPTPAGPLPDRPAIIFLNSGILHRVGSCRMHVRLARALAARGYASLRFDFSGIGDSDTRKDSLTFEESAPLEIVEAMDRVASLKGSPSFVLSGLCSGADAALLLAPQDARVVGLGLVDPWAYLTPKQRWVHYGLRARTWNAWHNQLRRYLPAVFGRLPTRDAVDALSPDFEIPTYVRGLPPRDEVAEMYRRLLARGTELFLFYTGGLEDYNYRTQFLDAFPALEFGSQLRLEFCRRANHIVSGLADQHQLDSGLLEWIGTKWPLSRAPAPGKAESPRTALAGATSGT